MKIIRINELPPAELERAVSLARTFPSPRTAREFWQIGEDILREKGAWPKLPFFKTTRAVFYSTDNIKGTNLGYRRDGSGQDFIIYSFLGENLFDIAVHRERGYSFNKYDPKDDISSEEAGKILAGVHIMQISALMLNEGKERRKYEF
jgi:hypothetical protein